jgi:predicted SAM-dependent methyltransferase
MDPSEDRETSNLRLHLGCGTVYLEGFTNIDIWREGFSFLASERPDLVSRNRTTFSKYYKDEVTKNTVRETREEPRYVVADRFQDIKALDYPQGSAELIVCVQTLEHLTRQEVSRALKNWHNILKPGGILHIDVPNFEETARQLLAQKSEEDKEWYYRLIYGSQKDNFSIHKDGYSEEKLRRTLALYTFKNIRRLPDTRHFYPSIIMECSK